MYQRKYISLFAREIYISVYQRKYISLLVDYPTQLTLILILWYLYLSVE